MKTHATNLIVLSLAVGVAAPQASAQDESSTGFVLEAGEHDISDIVDRAAKFLGRNLILQRSELVSIQNATTITLQKTLNLDVFGCEEVVSHLAWLKGLVMSPMDPNRGIYEFISVRGSRRGEIRSTFMTPAQVLKRPRLKIKVSTSIQLKHIDAMRASQYLRPFHSMSSRSGVALSIGTLGSRHALLLQGMADQVANAIQMVTLMDTPEAEDDQPGVDERIAALEKERASLLEELTSLRARIKALETKRK